jgi:N-acetylglutamate synthase-like GNAT family acetyltransferase
MRVEIREPTGRQFEQAWMIASAANIGAEREWIGRGLLVAVDSSQAIGCVALHAIGPAGILHHLAVAKELRRQGVGSRLVLASLKSARHRGVELVALRTMFWNIAFFRQCGFEPCTLKSLPAEVRRHPLMLGEALKRATAMTASAATERATHDSDSNLTIT